MSTTQALQSAIDDAASQGQAKAKTIAVVQQKGGSGKSTITINLAAVNGRSSVLSSTDDAEGAPVVAAGVDVQGTLEKWCARVREDALPFDYLVTKGKLGLLPEVAAQPDRKRIYIDTPGFLDVNPDAEWGADPLGEGRAADAMREVLDLTDLAIVPITPSWLTWEPAEYTIERILKPRSIPFLIVVNMHEPAKDKSETQLDKVKDWIDKRNYARMPDPIRKYNIHEHAAENGLVVTEYKMSGTALNAREDFMKLALTVEQAL